MLDNEKDKFIKETLQKDKRISDKANDIFKNMNYKQTKEIKTHKWIGKLLTVAATFVVVALSANFAIQYNKNTGVPVDKEVITISKENITPQEPAAKLNVVVKNKEVEVEEFKVVKVSENDLVKATLTTNNKVLLQLKEPLITKQNWNLDYNKSYEVSKVESKIKEVFVGYMGDQFPYIMLLTENATVECIQIFNEENTDAKELTFYNQGQVLGLTNIEGFEQKTEKSSNSNGIYYYINAIRKDGVKKQIELGVYNNMDNVSTNEVKFTSQDGENTYTINADAGDYIQAAGWAGASNNVYYINDSCLYHLSLVDGTKTKLVTGVTEIFQDDDMEIVVKLKYVYTIHQQDTNIILSRDDVSDSKIIDTQENDSMKLALKEDGSITVEFKLGGIKNYTSEETYFKERIRYNLYVMGYQKQEKPGAHIYANATAMYFGTIGTDGKECIAYATKDKHVVVFDIAEYIKNPRGTSFIINNEYIVLLGNYPNTIKKMQKAHLTIELEDGTRKDCDTIEVVYDNGNKAEVATSVLLNKLGYKNYKVITNNGLSQEQEKNTSSETVNKNNVNSTNYTNDISNSIYENKINE